MKIRNRLFLLSIELFTRCFIILWVVYLTATETELFSNVILSFLVNLVFITWIILPPIIDFIENKEDYSLLHAERLHDYEGDLK